MLELFDLNAHVGKPTKPAAEWYDTPAALLAEMDHYAIARAIVTHYAARQAHPDIGNAETMRFVGSRLAPAWSFVPSVGGRSDAPRVIEAALAAGVRILRYYPREYFVAFSVTAIGDFLEPMEERVLPLLVDFSSSTDYGQFETDWEGLVALCRAFPRLPVVTTEYRIRSNRMLFRALALCENLRVCTSAIWLWKNIDHIVAEFGTGRLVFGTNIPAFDPAIAVSMLRFADIPDEAKAAIASGNLAALLSGVKA